MSSLPAPHPSDPVGTLLAELAALPVDRDPVHAWMAAHEDELALYRGQRVAIDPERGIVASGADYGEVADRLDALGIPPESDVTIVVVPA